MSEVFFLNRSDIDGLHDRSLAEFGGLDGVRDSNALEGAISRAQTFAAYQEEADLFDIAAVYAYSISQCQAYLDGNKRTAVWAALTFLEGNGIDTDSVPDGEIYTTLIAIAEHKMIQDNMASLLRRHCLGP